VTTETSRKIWDIFCLIQAEKEYVPVWAAYAEEHGKLRDWADTLPLEDQTRLDDFIEAFFDLHMLMMDIALHQKEQTTEK